MKQNIYFGEKIRVYTKIYGTKLVDVESYFSKLNPDVEYTFLDLEHYKLVITTQAVFKEVANIANAFLVQYMNVIWLISGN